VKGITAAEPGGEYRHRPENMLDGNVMSFDDTMTEADFLRPLLDPSEERMLAALQPEPDLDVHGLRASLLTRLVLLFDRQEA